MDPEANEDRQDDELEATEDAPEPEAEEKVEPAAPRKRSWGLWLFVLFLVLVLAVVGIGWYASYLQRQVVELKAQLDEAEQKAGSLATTASAVANELMPLAEESALVAKLRQTSGDPEGAAGALYQARKIADMARRLTPTGAPAKLSEIERKITEVEAALRGGGESGGTEQETDEGAEAAEGPAEETPSADEAAVEAPSESEGAPSEE